MTDFNERLSIVRHKRWLAWGYGHGVRVRPQWLADAIVAAWNHVACHLYGHEWMPEIDWNDEPVVSETMDYCPNCCARRSV